MVFSKLKNKIFKPSSSREEKPQPIRPISSFIDEPAPEPVQQPKVLQRQPERVTYVTAENIRELRELIRYRYTLDVEIWEKRNVKRFQQYLIKPKMTRADAALATIIATLENWNRQEFFKTREEYERFCEIKRRIDEGDKRNWTKNPPWEETPIDPQAGPHEKDGRPIQYDVRVSVTRT